MERRYLFVASAVVLAGVLISASLLVTVGGSTVTRTITVSETSVSTIISTEQCTAVGVEIYTSAFPPPIDALVTANGLFNATLTGYSGSRQVFSQCYVGSGMSEIIPGTGTGVQNWTSARITAQKRGADNSNLTLIIHGVTNSTVAPFGFVSISTVPYNSSSG
jgi:hypothetical protein